MIEVVLNFKEATDGQKAFADKAIAMMKRIINHPEFLEKARTTTYTGRRFRIERLGVYYQTMTSSEIADIIQKGEEFRTAADSVIELTVRLRVLRANVLGSMSPPHPLITTNKTFFDDWLGADGREVSLAAHWLHEWLHVAGFRHKALSDGSPDRSDAAYMIGKICTEIGQDILNLDTPGLIASTAGQGYLDVPIAHEDEYERPE